MLPVTRSIFSNSIKYNLVLSSNKTLFCNVLSRSFHNFRLLLDKNQQKHYPDGTITYEEAKELKKALKRPPTAYMFFTKQARKEVKEEHPEIANSEILAEVARKWKNMSDDEKKPFKDQSEVASEKYYSEKREIESKLPPKKPCTPYLLYLKDVRATVTEENPDLTAVEIIKLLGSKWKSLDQDEKARYKEIYLQQRKEYEEMVQNKD